MSVAYNSCTYNAAPYNVLETLGLHLTLTLTDAIMLQTGKVLSEPIFMNDQIHKIIPLKLLSNTVRLTDWLSIKRVPETNDPWGD